MAEASFIIFQNYHTYLFTKFLNIFHFYFQFLLCDFHRLSSSLPPNILFSLTIILGFFLSSKDFLNTLGSYVKYPSFLISNFIYEFFSGNASCWQINVPSASFLFSSANLNCLITRGNTSSAFILVLRSFIASCSLAYPFFPCDLSLQNMNNSKPTTTYHPRGSGFTSRGPCVDPVRSVWSGPFAPLGNGLCPCGCVS